MARDTNRDFDPHGNFYFALEIGNTEVAHFQEVSGLKSSSTVFEIEEGGMNGYTHKRPGQSKWENLVCRYATSSSMALLEWRDAFLQDKFQDRVNNAKNHGAIIMYNNHGDEVRRYSFKNAWPVSWEGPQLSSGGSELAIETLEIAHEGLTVK